MGCGSSVPPVAIEPSDAPKPSASVQEPQSAPSAPKETDSKTEIDLSSKALKTIPADIFSHAALQTLVLKCCELSEVPDSISGLKLLVRLDVSENKLIALPQAMEGCENLEALDCSDNKITAWPDIVFPKLHTLEAYKNEITGIKGLPDALGKCTQLREVNFFNNKIKKIPANWSELTELEDVNFASNKLATIPKVDNWKKLKRLAVFWNNLVMLPSFASLESIEILQMEQNNLEAFPTMGNHPSLKEIDLSKNRIGELTEETFQQMPALESLQMKANHLKIFPDAICTSCPNLIMLNLSDCKDLTAMPGNIGDCANLKTVFWANTAITSLPESFEKLTLVRADLEGSQLDENSVAICARMKEKLAEAEGFFRY